MQIVKALPFVTLVPRETVALVVCREVVLAVQISMYLSGHQGIDFDSASHRLSLQPTEAMPGVLNVCSIRNLPSKQNGRGDGSKPLNIPKF